MPINCAPSCFLLVQLAGDALGKTGGGHEAIQK